MVAHDFSHPAPRQLVRPRLRLLGNFVQKPVPMLYDLTLSPLDKLVWEVVADQSWKTGECELPHATLAAMVGREPRTLQDSLKRLILRGALGCRRLGPTQAKAYWPLNPYGDDETVTRHTRKIAGVSAGDDPTHTREISETHAENFQDTREKLPDLKKTPVKTPEDDIPESGDPVLTSPAPARAIAQPMLSLDGPPRPAPKPQPLPATPAPEPPPPPPPPRAKRGSAEAPRPRTDPPETLEPTPALRTWALDNGFNEATLADEIERCLDHHRIKTLQSGNWQSSLRTWVKNEVAWAQEDGRTPGVHVGKARPKTPARRNGQSGDGDQSFRPGQMIGQVTGWPGAGYSDAALEAASDPGWFLKIPRDEQTDTQTDERRSHD